MIRSPSHPTVFLFNHTASPALYPLSLHDALPISHSSPGRLHLFDPAPGDPARARIGPLCDGAAISRRCQPTVFHPRSEEHTSELQSHVKLVCRLLLEKKKCRTRLVLAQPRYTFRL